MELQKAAKQLQAFVRIFNSCKELEEAADAVLRIEQRTGEAEDRMNKALACAEDAELALTIANDKVAASKITAECLISDAKAEAEAMINEAERAAQETVEAAVAKAKAAAQEEKASVLRLEALEKAAQEAIDAARSAEETEQAVTERIEKAKANMLEALG